MCVVVELLEWLQLSWKGSVVQLQMDWCWSSYWLCGQREARRLRRMSGGGGADWAGWSSSRPCWVVCDIERLVSLICSCSLKSQLIFYSVLTSTRVCWR